MNPNQDGAVAPVSSGAVASISSSAVASISRGAVAPTPPGARIQTLDVLRGVALLGILLLNIVGMGMWSTAYSSPQGGVAGVVASAADIATWLTVELLFEGSMRALFSMLFGASVVLFTTNKSGRLHYRRTFFLLLFGLIDGFLLQWPGDILVVYAIAGALLYLVRNASVQRLLVGAGALLVVLLLLRLVSVFGLSELQERYEQIQSTHSAGQVLTDEQEAIIFDWEDFVAAGLHDEEALAAERDARRGDYLSGLRWSAGEFSGMLLFVMPVFMLWDALVMMLIGMALFKSGVLQGQRSSGFYATLAVAGITCGLLVNSFEIQQIVRSDYDFLQSYSYIQPLYDFGRLGLGLGYMALVVWWCKRGGLAALQTRFAAVGRMALTNYLMQSLIALVLFSGAGFGLVGHLARWELYPVVLAIWLLQLWFSPWWLRRHQQGPLEALWRRLTYASASPAN